MDEADDFANTLVRATIQHAEIDPSDTTDIGSIWTHERYTAAFERMAPVLAAEREEARAVLRSHARRPETLHPPAQDSISHTANVVASDDETPPPRKKSNKKQKKRKAPKPPSDHQSSEDDEVEETPSKRAKANQPKEWEHNFPAPRYPEGANVKPEHERVSFALLARILRSQCRFLVFEVWAREAQEVHRPRWLLRLRRMHPPQARVLGEGQVERSALRRVPRQKGLDPRYVFLSGSVYTSF